MNYNKIIQDRQLYSVMNNTKWYNLFSELNEIEESIRFRVKSIDNDYFPENKIDFTGELQQINREFISIEHLDIDPYIKVNRGELMKPLINDLSSRIINILEALKINYKKEDSYIRIYGYLDLDKTSEIG